MSGHTISYSIYWRKRRKYRKFRLYVWYGGLPGLCQSNITWINSWALSYRQLWVRRAQRYHILRLGDILGRKRNVGSVSLLFAKILNKVPPTFMQSTDCHYVQRLMLCIFNQWFVNQAIKTLCLLHLGLIWFN